MTTRRRRTRVVITGAAFALCSCVLWGRLLQVQYFRHDQYAEAARRQQAAAREIPAQRGGIFDRLGRPLSISARLWSVAVVVPEVKKRSRVVSQLSERLGIPRAEITAKLAGHKNFVWIDRQRELGDRAVAELSAIAGVQVNHEPGRVRPYGAVGAKIVGFTGFDNGGMAGMEAALDGVLKGSPGLETVVINANYRTDRYQHFVHRHPRNGRNVYLTIDAVIQEIAEDELHNSIREHGARSGSVIVMDVTSGEILALAEYPAWRGDNFSRADSLWTVGAISHVYEPGSTFKIVTASALLELERVDPSDTFDAENGTANLGFATIRDTHPHGIISFADAFSLSSNIVMSKASRRLRPEEFYRMVKLFGFGEKTGVDLLGESAGTVPPLGSWSLRTQGTMAFGQEVAVTQLQMLCALAAIANDGEMMMPRIVRGVTSADGGVVVKAKPVTVRRVISSRTARKMREFCRKVVTDGTGKSASLDFMDVAGKTGTAQKAAGGQGYVENRYVSSFIGFAPFESPSIACLVVLDEPKWSSRYGGDCAAPVFARVLRSMANSTTTFDRAVTNQVVEAPVRHRDESTAPNFIRMDRAEALEHARKVGANVLVHGENGRVVSQEPGPGQSMERDAVIRLVVLSGDMPRADAVPDFRGLSMREARQVALRTGVRAAFDGTGVVRSQRPAPGTRARGALVKLSCDGGDRLKAGSSR